MRRRHGWATVAVLALAGVAWFLADEPVVAVETAVAVAGDVFLALVVVAALVVLAHQYRRWREYRPAIHVALLLVAFVIGLAFLTGPSDPSVGSGSLSPSERATVRTAALGLLFAVLLTLAHHFGGDRGLE